MRNTSAKKSSIATSATHLEVEDVNTFFPQTNSDMQNSPRMLEYIRRQFRCKSNDKFICDNRVEKWLLWSVVPGKKHLPEHNRSTYWIGRLSNEIHQRNNNWCSMGSIWIPLNLKIISTHTYTHGRETSDDIWNQLLSYICAHTSGTYRRLDFCKLPSPKH